MKNKGEKGRYIQLNADFLGRARSDKKTFFNEERIKLEENNRSGKTRDHVRKIGNIKGTFGRKIDKIKNINCRNPVNAAGSRRDGKNTWKNCIKKIQTNWMTTMMWSAAQSQTFWRAKSSVT